MTVYLGLLISKLIEPYLFLCVLFLFPTRFNRRMTDCGLFVLFFMERFIEKAPERLKRKDLAMVRYWFS